MRFIHYPNGAHDSDLTPEGKAIRKADLIFDTRDAINWRRVCSGSITRSEYEMELRRIARAHRFAVEVAG